MCGISWLPVKQLHSQMTQPNGVDLFSLATHFDISDVAVLVTTISIFQIQYQPSPSKQHILKDRTIKTRLL
jgi:hypothetical protein